MEQVKDLNHTVGVCMVDGNRKNTNKTKEFALRKPLPDISLELEILRSKLLFVEGTFFALAHDGEFEEKLTGLGYIVGDLADQVQAIYDKLYKTDPESLDRKPGPQAREARPRLSLLAPSGS